jgi:nicotinamide riboside kinase
MFKDSKTAPKVIAFSGACNSGKTTLIRQVASVLATREINVVSIYDNIHGLIDSTGLSIDELRKNQQEFFAVEQVAICEKIKNETEAIRSVRNGIILIDRTLFDSYYYLTKYVHDANVTCTPMFKEFKRYALAAARYASTSIYDKIYILDPITSIESNKYRPVNLLREQLNEYETIKEIIFENCADSCKIICADNRQKICAEIVNLAIDEK